jgi:hypothetical protein
MTLINNDNQIQSPRIIFPTAIHYQSPINCVWGHNINLEMTSLFTLEAMQVYRYFIVINFKLFIFKLGSFTIEP